jgi:6-phosphogluconolactonase
MTRPPTAPPPTLPARVVVGGYSLEPEGDAPQAGTGLRVLDLDAGDEDGARYVIVAHEPLRSPTWVVAHPDQPWLVSVGETSPSEVVCTRLDTDGGLTVLGRQATGGDAACHLALVPSGGWVVVAHYGSGTVESFALADDGTLTGPQGRFAPSAPTGPDPDRQDGPHAHQVVVDPGGTGELLVCDLGTDRVHRLRLHPDGRLSEAADALVLPPGFGPRHLVVADDTLVVAGELSVELWVGRRTQDGWVRTQVLPTTSRSPAERAASAAPALPSGLRLVGDQVVVATRGTDTVSVFALDRDRSAGSFVGEVSCRGQHPRDVVVADGRVWVANQESDEVVVLDLAAVAAGREEEPVVRLAVPRPACVVLVDGRATSARQD